MSINTYQSNELATQRKIMSDFKNDTDDLIFSGSRETSSYVKAFRAVRDREHTLNIKYLERETSTDYYLKLMDEM